MHTIHRLAAVLAPAILVALPALAQPVLHSPVTADAGPQAIRPVSIDSAELAAIRAQQGPFLLTGFPMPRGASADLALEPFSVLTPDAQVVLGTEHGDAPIGAPEVTLLHGTVAGDPESSVFLSFSMLGANGVIRAHGQTVVLSSGAFTKHQQTVIADMADFPEPPEFAKGWECHVGPEHFNPLGLDLTGPQGRGGARDNPCRIARVAVDTDYEYSAWLFAGNLDASAAYAVTLLGAVSEIYTRDLNVRLVVPYVRVWDADVDPYGGDRLSELQAYWSANMSGVKRELAHLLSGNYGGGVAWVGTLCSTSYGYGLSGVAGGFPYPLRDHDGGNWDLMVVAHEIGHNFGTLHTHDGYDPHIDDCGNGDCTLAWGGTIMSYCHTCAGGMTNIVLHFHPRVIDQISNYLNGACNILGSGRAFAYDDETIALENSPVNIDVLANDLPINCSTPGIFTVQGTSDQGGSVALSQGTGEGGRDEVRYTPPAGFNGTDTFFYIMQTANGVTVPANVRADVLHLRPADTLGVSRLGVTTDYYVLQTAEQLPDFNALTPYARDYLPDINIPSTNGYFATSGRYEYVGAVLHAYLHVPQNGYYTLYVESDDGSRLFVGDEKLIENDGIHRMTERSGGIALAAGWHRLRVEYFEKTQAQGLIVRIEGPGLPKQPVPPESWRTTDCVADWVPDGAVNTIDFIGFLGDWSTHTPATDLDGNGLLNTADVVQFLNAWVSGCP
ncbi:MAG: hypothetical protein IPJ41_01645 [Phycisphaerales bacterium]|nr:hypothetical protein [Phycisphaerales bacterium]